MVFADKRVLRTFTHKLILIPHACMLAKAAILRKLNPRKPFERYFRENNYLYQRKLPAIR